MKTISKTCSYCHNSFEASLKEHNRGNAKYCCRKCNYDSKKGITKLQTTNCVCTFCSKAFYRNTSKQKNAKSGLQFCCRKCKDDAQKLSSNIKAIHPSHYGTGNSIPKYRKIAFANLEVKCNRCGFEKYPDILEVHHKNLNRKINTLDNLEILCPTCHQIEHFKSKTGRYSTNK